MAIVAFDKIKGLVYTEKSNKQLEQNKYHFDVDKSCTKNEIASLIKKSFGVEVEKVNVINTKSKVKRFRGIVGQTKAYKKAIVTLKAGQTINFGS